MPTSAAQQTAQTPLEAGELLSGDLGLMALKALLQNGVGWVAAAWDGRPSPIDAALDDARETVLQEHGVQIRRVRNIGAIEALIADPGTGVHAGRVAPRGAVVLAGRRGMREPIRRLGEISSAGPVIIFCFDPSIVGVEGALVIDPVPTATGLVAAVDRAFALSHASGRSVCVVIRDRLVGMRGTIRCRADVDAADGRELDHQLAQPLQPADAVATTGCVDVQRSSRGSMSSGQSLIVTPQWCAGAAAAIARDERIDAVSLLVPTLLPSGEAGMLITQAERILVIDDTRGTLGHLIETAVPNADVTCVTCDADAATDRVVRQAVTAWQDASDETSRVLAAIVDDRAVLDRMPRRNEVLHRSVSPVIAAALSLAQGVIGVPSRVSDEYPTYRGETGVCLTVVSGELFAQHGAACIAPDAGIGVVLIPDAAGSDVQEAAAAMGATIEFADATSARSIGRAIATACQSVRAVPHVICVADVVRAPLQGRAIGIDEDLLGTDRIAASGIPVAARTLAEVDDPLLPGPVVRVSHAEALACGVAPMAELTPSVHDVRVTHRAGASRWADTVWAVRSRLVRIITGVST